MAVESVDEGFGILLRQYRLAAGLTQEALAERAGLSSVGVGALERGDRRAPRFATVKLLAQALCLTPAELVRLQASARPGGSLAAAPTATPLTNLPFPVTSFRGRERETEQLARLVTDRRLVTLCGVGGIGKTRLALETGRRIRAENPAAFPGGVWFADLTSLEDPSLVDHQIARVMGIEVRPDVAPFAALVGGLHDAQALLILDNCEHILEAVAQLTSQLIAACPRLHLLTTSREILRIAGERVERLSALGLPEAGDEVGPSIAELLASPAVRLFLDRAADSGPAQPVVLEDPEARRALVTVARRLEGIPLAIELAAGRVGSLPLAALAQRLDDRFRVLATGDRAARPRHQTLRATLDWSYDLLAKSEQRLLDRLSVFAGSFPLAAAQIVCGCDRIAPDDVPELLASLVDKSLVIAEVRLAEPRYRLLEMIRSYSVERLAREPGERARVARRHADYYRRVAEQIDVAAATFKPTHHAFEGILDDVRGALTWALRADGDADLAVALVVAVRWAFSRWVFDSLSLNAEGTTWCERALAVIGKRTQPRQEADILRNIAMFCWWSDTERTLAAADRAVALYRQLDDRPNLGNALTWQALAQHVCGERAEACRLATEAVELVPALGHERYRVLVLTVRAMTMPAAEAPVRWRLLDEALALCDRHAPESNFAVPLVLSACAQVAFESGELERAREYARRRIDEFPKQATPEFAFAQLAYYALAAGDTDATRAAAREALRVPGSTSRAFFRAVRTIAGAAAHDGDPVTAAQLLGAVDALAEAASHPQTATDLAFRRQAYALVQAALPDEDRVARLLTEGRMLTREQLLAQALCLTPAELVRLQASSRPGGSLAAAPTATPLTNLPFPVTSFRGRERETEQLARLVTDRRLVTLCGVGGIGKTRLALETGRRITVENPAAFPGGVWFADLTPLEDPALVDHQIARAIGIEVRPDAAPFAVLVGGLHDAQALLILDNCEHILEAVAQLTSRLIATCPRLHLLTTSREILRIAGERVERLSALELPQASDEVGPSIAELLASPAVRLFLDRAADSGPAQPVVLEDPEARRALVTVARRLEGIPLAIELAAGRMGSLPLAALAQRLDDRFRLLSTGDRAARPRHQTLRAALDWSYDLLAETEQRLLDRLSVFAGSISLEAAQIVCGCEQIAPDDVPELLASLVDKSLVIAEVRLAEPRYRLLEMIRAYSVERLAREPGERARVARRHADYYRRVAEQIDVAGATFKPTHHAFEGILDDVRGALTWALRADGDPNLAAALVIAVRWAFNRWVFDSLSLNAEGVTWCERALAASAECAQPRQQADLLRNIAMFCWWSDTKRTLAAADRAATLYRQLDDRPNLGNVLTWQALALQVGGERAEACRLATEAVGLVPALGHERYRVLVLTVRAMTMPAAEAPARWRLLDEALALCDRHAPESSFAVPLVLSACAKVAFESGELERAREYARRRIDEFPKQATPEFALAQLAYYAFAAGYPRQDGKTP